MFDLDAGKILLFSIVALVVVGPKELPALLRKVGEGLGKLQALKLHVRRQWIQLLQSTEMSEDLKALKRETEYLRSPSSSFSSPVLNSERENTPSDNLPSILVSETEENSASFLLSPSVAANKKD